jgi:two-component system LytT family response regulator/two-component system response regulator LytT
MNCKFDDKGLRRIIAAPLRPRLYWNALSMPINTLIVDDEKPAREELAFLLKAFPDIHLIAQGKNGIEAVNLIREHAPDLVFLDVQMPGLDGFGVLQKLVDRKIEVPHVVFATAFDHYAVQAFDVNAVDYVLKPFDKARIAKAIQRARREIESEVSPADRLEQLVSRLAVMKNSSAKATAPAPSKILVNLNQKLVLMDAEDIIFATIGEGMISIIARDLEATTNHRTLDELEDALASESFFRAHRSFLVNIHHIREVVPWFKSTFVLKMNDKNKTEVPVSRTQTKRLRELFKL